MRTRPTVFVLCLALLAGGARAQTTRPASPGSGDQVTREEYEKLKREQDEMRREMAELRHQLEQERAARAMPQPAPAPALAPATAPATPADEFATREDTDDLQKQIKALREDADHNRFGTSQFHLAGDASVGFTMRKNEKSTFDAGVAPLILWEPDPKILIEAGFDIAGEVDDNNESSTSFDLTLINISYLVNDNLYVGGGLFVVPFGVYHSHFDPPWINKFPDDPLPFADGGIAPAEETGLFMGGAAPVGDTKVTYNLYVTNGPNLYTNADQAGQLNFDDYTDLNNGKAVGGRIGFLPRPNIEMGYSALFSQVNPPHFSNTNVFLQAVDLNVRQDVKPLGGQIDFRTEWVWSHVDRATYDSTGADGFGPLAYSNDRYGGYVQLCYRPTMADNKYVRNTELVSRYDIMRSPDNAPGGDREQRFTFGLDYWLTPAIVLKAAYQFDDKDNGEDQNGVLFQIGMGL